MAEVRKVTDEDNTVRLIMHEASILANAAVFMTDYAGFAERTAQIAGELLALSNHLRSKLEPVVVPPYAQPSVLEPVKPRTRRKAT